MDEAATAVQPRARPLIVLVSVVAAILLAEPAAASPLLEGSGISELTSITVTRVQRVDGLLIQTARETRTFSGTLTGTAVTNLTIIFYPDGLITLEGFGTCTCTVDGRSGTARFYVALVVPDRPGIRIEEGVLMVLGGTGGLTNLHAAFRVDGDAYAGTYMFERA